MCTWEIYTDMTIILEFQRPWGNIGYIRDFWTKEKGVKEVLYWEVRRGDLQVAENSWTSRAGKVLLDISETMTHREFVGNGSLPEILCLPYLSHIWLMWHLNIPYWSRFLWWNLLDRKGDRVKISFSVLFLNKQLNTNIPQSNFGVARLWFPLLGLFTSSPDI